MLIFTSFNEYVLMYFCPKNHKTFFVCSFIRNISVTFSYSSGEVVSVNICMALLRWVFKLP